MILVTEWSEFAEMDLERVRSAMRGNYIVDARNLWDPHEMKKMGFEYIGVGR